MSMIVRHKIRGLNAWQGFRYPDVNCRIGSGALYIWHRSELRIVDLGSFEVTRTVSIPDQVIEFIEVFSCYCFVVTHSSDGSTVHSFNLNSCLINTFFISKEQIVSIEQIDALNYAAGTESCKILWIEHGILKASYKVMEIEHPPILSLRGYILNDENYMACGLANGQVKLVSYTGVIDSLPKLEETGKIVGIEFMNYNNKDYFVLFSESPACLKVIAQSDEQSDFYEEFSTNLEQNASLLQMTCHEGVCVFILTLHSSILTLYYYSGGRQLNMIYQSDIDIVKLKDVVCLGIPEHSLFHNSKESGCDLCMVVNGGSEIQTINLTSSQLEKISGEISENCSETSIWQKPDLLTKVIREFSDLEECKFIDSNYPTEDLKVLDILIGLEKSSLICDFLIRQAGDNFVLPEDYVDLVDTWVSQEMAAREKCLFDTIVPNLIMNFEVEDSLNSLEKFLMYFFEYEKIGKAVERRTQNKNRKKQARRLIFIAKVVAWINKFRESADVQGLEWQYQRVRFESLIGEYRGDVYLKGIYIDQWAGELPEGLQSIFYNPLTYEGIYKLLIETNQQTFCRLFLYFLFELSHQSLESYEIVEQFTFEFLITNSEFHFVRGHWCLDTMLHQKVLPLETRNTLQIYASDALHELSKVVDLLSTEEKLSILNYFTLIPTLEQAIHWILISDLDFTNSDCIKAVMQVIFSGHDQVDPEYEWIRAYCFISLLKDQVPNLDQFMEIFSRKMQEINKGHKLPNIAFDPVLQKAFLSNLPQDPSIKFFTFFANHKFEQAFTQGHINIPQLYENFNKCIRYKKDLPTEQVHVDYKPLFDGSDLRNLNIHDKPAANPSDPSENFFSGVFN